MNPFDIIDNLLILEQNGKGIRDFFEVNHVKRVIVYGLGRIGVRLVTALEKAEVSIACVMDREANSIVAEGIDVILPDAVSDYANDVDLIIVSVSNGYYEIKEELERKTDISIISIKEIIDYCMDGESELGLKVYRKPVKAICLPKNKVDVGNRSRKILIFGGGSGIGKAIAYRMLCDGADVVIAGRNEKKLFDAKCDLDNKIKSMNVDKLHYGTVYTLHADISEISQHGIFFEKANKCMGGVDSFVNSAAITLQQRGRGYEPWDVTENEWDEVADTDFKGAFFLIRNEVDYLLKNHISGNILNIASNAAYTDIVGLYGASKLSLIKWTRAFGKRFGHNGIVINGIAPGATYTEMIASYAKSVDQEYPRHAIERFIRPEEIAELACFCLSAKGVTLCGSTILADGGDSVAY